mmetsp:Transcript_2881/g.6725  ORF Transcript_2881/g.6725 Transcript_2881/m.6725 type:complete len:126 (+) Transcript_2881:439-816(+)
MQDQWMRDGKGFLLVYSICDKQSFDKVQELREKILRTKDSSDVPMVIVGNKCDLEDERQVLKEDGKRLADSWGCPFYETSAKERINNERVFFELVREIRKAEVAKSKASDPRPPRPNIFKRCTII